MWWSYKTNVGTFSIKPVSGGKFALYVDNQPLGTPQSTAELAAYNVGMCSTGYLPWDQQEDFDHPRNLDEWQKHR